MENYTALIYYLFIAILLVVVFLFIYWKNKQSSEKTISTLTKQGAKKVIWRKKHGLASSSDEVEVIFGKSYGEELEKYLDLKDVIERQVEKAKNIIQHVNDNYFIKFDEDNNIWKAFCYWESQKIEVDIKADTICQLIINDKKQPHLSPKILDGALSELIAKIIEEVKKK